MMMVKVNQSGVFLRETLSIRTPNQHITLLSPVRRKILQKEGGVQLGTKVGGKKSERE